MIVVKCGCSLLMEKIDNKKRDIKYVVGICDTCIKNDCQFVLSPHWKEVPEATDQQKRRR